MKLASRQVILFISTDQGIFERQAGTLLSRPARIIPMLEADGRAGLHGSILELRLICPPRPLIASQAHHFGRNPDCGLQGRKMQEEQE